MISVESFEWDEANLEHIGRHGVRDYEVEDAILFDRPVYLKGSDDRYYAYGVTEDGKHLFVVFTVIGNRTIRVITARDMTRKERAYYRKRRP